MSANPSNQINYNDLTDFGYYAIAGAQYFTNKPSGNGTQGFMIVGGYHSERLSQLVVLETGIFVRYNNGSWSAWKTATLS